jgi:formyltetrahydrofolate synthetase
LKIVFSEIKEAVLEKYPNNEIARYTAISGFIFLRFFAPAILGPTLFGLKIGNFSFETGLLDSKSSRKLVLIAKTLQNLSNLVEFGQKEPYMAAMNTFIQDKMEEMKKFLDKISVKSDVTARTQNFKSYSETTSAKDAAILHTILSESIQKMRAFNQSSEILETLEMEIEKIAQNLSKIQEIEQQFQYNVFYDSGVDADDIVEPVENVCDAEDERKIMRMLTRCTSKSSLDSVNSNFRNSIASYQSSSEIKDLMIKGHPQKIESIPIVPIKAQDSAVG